MDIVHDEGLRIMISYADSRLTLPSRGTIANDVTQLARINKREERLKRTLKKLNCLQQRRRDLACWCNVH